MKTAEELWELWHQARNLPYGSAQIALIEQMLRHVDGAGDPELGFLTRLLGTTAYVYGGEPAKAFVTFSWCVSDFDRNPSDYHKNLQHNLLWQFKAMVNALTKFPEVPLERTRAVLDDMERRYRETGHGMQAVYKHRYLVARHVGQDAEADEWYGKWQSTPRDSLSDCAGCDPTDVAEYLAERGRHAEAVAHAHPILAGELDCSEQPQRILAVLMVPYLRVGRPEEAAAAHRRSYRLERGSLADLSDIAAHIEFCARTGNEHRGLEILQRHVDWLEKAPSPSAAMDFAAAGGLLLRRLTELGHGDATVNRRDRGEITAAALATEMAARATELAARFDARNGTDRVSRTVAERLAAVPYEIAVPLSPAARPAPVAEVPQEEEPVPEVPEVSPADLLDLARDHYGADRFTALATTLDALDARFPGLDDPLLLARRAVQRGNHLRITGAGSALELWAAAAERFAAAGAAREASEIRARIALDRAEEGEIDEEPIRSDVTYQDEHGDPTERAGAWSRLSALHLLQERFDEANEAGDRGDEFAAQSGDARLIALHALRRARVRAAADRVDEARSAAREAWEFYREHGPARWLAQAATLRGHLAETPQERVEMFGSAIATGDRATVLSARVGRGHALKELERPGEAVADLVEAVALCAERELDEGGAFARYELAEAYAQAGRPIEAAEVAEEALLVFDRTGNAGPANNARYLLAQQYREIGDTDGALALFRQLIERMAGQPGDRGALAEEAGDLLFDLDRDAAAAELFEAAAADRREAGDLIGELRVLRRRIAALHFADQVEAAEEAIGRAAARWAELPPEQAAVPEAIWQHGITAFEAARVLMSRGRYAEALPHLRGADVPVRAIGAGDDADHLAGMYGEALLRSGAPAEAEAHLRGVLDGMAPDAPGRESVEKVHVEARQALGKS